MSTDPTNNKYLGVEHQDLRFVRVMKGIEGCETTPDGGLNLALLDEHNAVGKRNTTHGTLNAIVADHTYGTFSESRFAVVGELMQMSQQNELLSVSAADTYFWNQDKKISVPNATLFAPEGENLPKGMDDNLNVIRYKADNDPRTNFENMYRSVSDHFTEQNLPFHAVDNHGWTGRGLEENRDTLSGENIKNLSAAVGYKLESGLHDGTAYSELENAHTSYFKLNRDFASINNAAEFEEANRKRQDEDFQPNMMEQLDRADRQYKDKLAELPVHHRAYYTQNLGAPLASLRKDMNEKMDQWYGAEPAPSVLPTPIPSGMPPVPPAPLPSGMPPVPQEAPPSPDSKQPLRLTPMPPGMPPVPPPQANALNNFLRDYNDNQPSASTIPALQAKNALSHLGNDVNQSYDDLQKELKTNNMTMNEIEVMKQQNKLPPTVSIASDNLLDSISNYASGHENHQNEVRRSIDGLTHGFDEQAANHLKSDPDYGHSVEVFKAEMDVHDKSLFTANDLAAQLDDKSPASKPDEPNSNLSNDKSPAALANPADISSQISMSLDPYSLDPNSPNNQKQSPKDKEKEKENGLHI